MRLTPCSEVQSYVITAPVPNGMTVAASAISQGASGATSGCGASVCGPGTMIQWGNVTGYPVGVGAGQSVTVTFAALVDATNPPANGTVIRSTAVAGSASAAVDVVIGP